MQNQSMQPRAILERAHVVSTWPSAAIDALCAAAELKHCGDGERVVSAGESADAVWIVAEGDFLLSKPRGSGHRLLYAWLKPGQITGVLSVFDGRSAAFDVIARGRGTMLVVPGRVLRGIARAYPAVALDIIAYLCRRERMDHEAIDLHAMNSVRCRVAKAVLSLAGDRSPPNADGEIDIKISQDDLADIVCAVRQSVNRELRRLMKDGILKQRYKTLVIVDRERLMRVAADEENLPPAAFGRPAPHSGHLYPSSD